ncbi:MAG: hypothetical protein ABW047_04255, partial [Nitrospiraceae bacterium]
MNRTPLRTSSLTPHWIGAQLCILCLFLSHQGFAAPTGKAHQKARPGTTSPAVATALQYAQALAGGDRMTVAKLDFSCQYPIVAAAASGVTSAPPKSEPSYEACLQNLSVAHASALSRDDEGMDVIWPSNGPLVS